MMWPTSLGGLLFPAVAIVFLMLYVIGIQAGIEPEIALLRAGLAGVALAALGRASLWILMNAPTPAPAHQTGLHLDVVLDEATQVMSQAQFGTGHVPTNGHDPSTNGFIHQNGQAGPGGKE